MRSWPRALSAALAALFLICAPPALAQDGANAAQSGASFESEIEQVLAARGLRIIANRDWNEAELYANPNQRAVITDAPYNSIYGGRTNIEFLLILGERQILIETKRQTAAGSVDEKLPFVFANARHNWPDREFVFVMDGHGWREGAEAWIRARAAETEGFTVLRAEDFPAWLDAQLR
jgi:hypothetical protein